MSVSYEASVIETQENGSDKVVRTMLIRCVHCGAHFERPRNGGLWCGPGPGSCNGPVCPNPD